MARRPTIIDVAQLAKVSKATVARVVNGQHDIVSEPTRERVEQAIEQLGYERNAVASSLRTDQTFVIALSIPDISNPFWPEVTRGVQDTLEESNYAVVTLNTDWKVERERNYLKMIRRNRFDGLIINPNRVSSSELSDLKIPVVILGGVGAYSEFDSVGSATEYGAQEAFKHLYELGHRRIGLITAQSLRNKTHTRRDSYLKFLVMNHISLDETLIIESKFSHDAGYDAMQQFLMLPNPPSAIVAANDILAIGALKAAQELQYRVPENISIVGIDDIYAAATTSPALTTVAKLKYETGVQAAKLLLERITGQAPPTARHIQLPCTLVIRESTASF
jgi:LacI family transcriptional regulator, galactose operon repressor